MLTFFYLYTNCLSINYEPLFSNLINHNPLSLEYGCQHLKTERERETDRESMRERECLKLEEFHSNVESHNVIICLHQQFNCPNNRISIFSNLENHNHFSNFASNWKGEKSFPLPVQNVMWWNGLKVCQILISKTNISSPSRIGPTQAYNSLRATSC